MLRVSHTHDVIGSFSDYWQIVFHAVSSFVVVNKCSLVFFKSQQHLTPTKTNYGGCWVDDWEGIRTWWMLILLHVLSKPSSTNHQWGVGKMASLSSTSWGNTVIGKKHISEHTPTKLEPGPGVFFFPGGKESPLNLFRFGLTIVQWSSSQSGRRLAHRCFSKSLLSILPTNRCEYVQKHGVPTCGNSNGHPQWKSKDAHW